MQSSKKSKKTLSSAEPAAPAVTEKAAKPRATKSSSTLKSSAAAPVAEKSAPEKKLRTSVSAAPIPAAATHSDTPRPVLTKPLSHDEVAKLAYSLWAARGYQHGSPEEDWLSAEKQLKSLAAGA